MPPRKAPKNAFAAAALGSHDHMSNLPDGVLQHILSFLPAQDVVRTCVLAKRWRHVWKSTTGLRFLCGRTMEPKYMDQIEEFVDRLLRLRIHGGTPLDICEFRLGYDDRVDMTRIIIWIRIALQCKVQVLHLFCPSHYLDIDPRDSHPFFISQYLKKLELQGFGLQASRLLDFSCCPNLEDLEIVNCCLEGALLISSQSLKRLTLTIFRGPDEYSLRMSIYTPNLVSLWFEVGDGRTPSLQRMPSLLTAFVKIHSNDRITMDSDDHDDNNQCTLLQGLSEVRKLVLMSPDTKMFVFRRDLKFCSSFNKLKSLLLDEYWCEPSDFSALACILKLSPVLEKLTLQLYSEGPNHKVEIKLSCKPLEVSTEISQHLKTLEVNCEAYDKRVRNVLTFLSKKLNIWFQFSG